MDKKDKDFFEDIFECFEKFGDKLEDILEHDIPKIMKRVEGIAGEIKDLMDKGTSAIDNLSTM